MNRSIIFAILMAGAICNAPLHAFDIPIVLVPGHTDCDGIYAAARAHRWSIAPGV